MTGGLLFSGVKEKSIHGVELPGRDPGTDLKEGTFERQQRRSAATISYAGGRKPVSPGEGTEKLLQDLGGQRRLFNRGKVASPWNHPKH